MMDDYEIERRVRLIRACLHRRAHYLDDNGNRRCLGCDAFIRPIEGVALIKTLNGAPC